LHGGNIPIFSVRRGGVRWCDEGEERFVVLEEFCTSVRERNYWRRKACYFLKGEVETESCPHCWWCAMCTHIISMIRHLFKRRFENCVPATLWGKVVTAAGIGKPLRLVKLGSRLGGCVLVGCARGPIRALKWHEYYRENT